MEKIHLKNPLLAHKFAEFIGCDDIEQWRCGYDADGYMYFEAAVDDLEYLSSQFDWDNYVVIIVCTRVQFFKWLGLNGLYLKARAYAKNNDMVAALFDCAETFDSENAYLKSVFDAFNLSHDYEGTIEQALTEAIQL